jgi:hypothetical protein
VALAWVCIVPRALPGGTNLLGRLQCRFLLSSGSTDSHCFPAFPPNSFPYFAFQITRHARIACSGLGPTAIVVVQQKLVFSALVQLMGTNKQRNFTNWPLNPIARGNVVAHFHMPMRSTFTERFQDELIFTADTCHEINNPGLLYLRRRM